MAAWATHPDEVKGLLEKSPILCGTGDIGFDITSIKVALTITDETIRDPNLSGKTTGFVTFKPKAEAKTAVTNTQELDYTLWPVDLEVAKELRTTPSQEDFDRAPIAKALKSFRDGLIRGSQVPAVDKKYPGAADGKFVPALDRKLWQPACFTDYNPEKPSDDSGFQFKLGLTFVNDQTYGFEISLWLLDFSNSTENKSSTGNTITVTFVQSGAEDLQILADEVTKQCNFLIRTATQSA